MQRIVFYRFIFITLLTITLPIKAQVFLSLDSCRSLAIANNKSLLISSEKQKAAEYERKSAFANYLPNISVTGSYLHNQKETSLLSDEQKQALSNIGSTMGNAMASQMQGILQQLAAQDPTLAQTMGQLINGISQPLAQGLNSVGQNLVDGLRTDTRNIFFAGISLTQPIYMGGKIRAYNVITKFAEDLAQQQHNIALQEVVYNADAAYWQAISLVAKKKLAQSYLDLLKKMDEDVQKMIQQGVATKADGLTVSVKLNEAEMTMTKVENGLALSKMLLCQICGLPLQTELTLADENIEDIQTLRVDNVEANAEVAFNNRPELKSLELATKMYEKKVAIIRSEYLPTVAFLGNYVATNPSLLNGFETKFKGMWNVGFLVKVPIWHWNEGSNKIKAAKTDQNIARYQYEEAREKIELQVNQAIFKVNEAQKKLAMSEKNRDKADENLRYAQLGFREGVIATSNLLEAQTAWLSAQSEKIDAQIEVKLTEVYLNKSLGTLY